MTTWHHPLSDPSVPPPPNHTITTLHNHQVNFQPNSSHGPQIPVSNQTATSHSFPKCHQHKRQHFAPQVQPTCPLRPFINAFINASPRHIPRYSPTQQRRLTYRIPHACPFAHAPRRGHKSTSCAMSARYTLSPCPALAHSVHAPQLNIAESVRVWLHASCFGGGVKRWEGQLQLNTPILHSAQPAWMPRIGLKSRLEMPPVLHCSRNASIRPRSSSR